MTIPSGHIDIASDALGPAQFCSMEPNTRMVLPLTDPADLGLMAGRAKQPLQTETFGIDPEAEHAALHADSTRVIVVG